MVVLLVMVWLLLPFITIPYAIVVKAENNRLKQQLDACLKETYAKQKSEKNDVSIPVPDHVYTEPVNCNNSEILNSVPVKTEEPENVVSEETTETATEFITENEKNSEPHISRLLVAGVSMILIAGLIFVTTTWAAMGPLAKMFIIMLAPVLFFGISSVADKKLHIHSTSKAFYYLGAFFIPISVVAMFFFQVFGEYFSFAGEGMFLALMAVFLSCAFSAVLVTKKYDSKLSAFITLMSFSAAFMMFALWTGSVEVFIIMCALYSFAFLFISNERLESLRVPEIYISISEMFASFNISAMSVIAFLIAAAEGSVVCKILGAIFLLSGTLCIQFRTENKITKTICSVCSVFEYSILFVVLDNALNSNGFEFFVLFALYVAAFLVYTLNSRYQSSLSRMLLVFTQFILMMTSGNDYKTVWTAVMLVSVAAAFITEKNIVLSSVYAVISPFVLYRMTDLCTSSFKAAAVVYIIIISVVSLISVFLSGRSEKFRFSSAVYLAFTGFSSVYASVFFSESSAMRCLMLLSAAVLGTAYYCFTANNRKISAVLSGITALTHIHIFMLLLFLFDIEATDEMMYLFSSVMTLILSVCGMFITKKHGLTGKIILNTSWISMFLYFVLDMPDSDSVWPFVFWAVISAYFFISGKAEDGAKAGKVLFTLSSVTIALAFIIQRLIEIPDLIMPEYIVLCSMIPYIFLFRIWYEDRGTIESILFGHTIIAMLPIMITALAESEVFHAVVLGIVSVSMLIISAVIRSRRWMKLGSATLFILIMYFTRDFWLSIAWWVYLMAAGIILIAYAAFNEYCKKTGTENFIRDKIKKFFVH